MDEEADEWSSDWIFVSFEQSDVDLKSTPNMQERLERFFEKCEAVFGQKTRVKQWIKAHI